MAATVFCETLLLFFCYAFLGWCTEVSYHAMVTGRFVNRGFLSGPLCPIYGFGAMAVIFFLSPIADNLPLLFIAALVLTSVLELFTGVLLEKLFHARWWDYSDEPLHLGPYVCLQFSLIWGFACVLVVRLLHPLLLSLMALLPLWLEILLLSLFSAGLVADLWTTAASATRMFRHLAQLETLSKEISNLSDRLGEKISDSTLELMELQKQGKERLVEYKEQLDEHREQLGQRLESAREAYRQKLSDLPRSHRRLLRAFPSMRSIAHPQILKAIREALEHLKKD